MDIKQTAIKVVSTNTLRIALALAIVICITLMAQLTQATKENKTLTQSKTTLEKSIVMCENLYTEPEKKVIDTARNLKKLNEEVTKAKIEKAKAETNIKEGTVTYNALIKEQMSLVTSLIEK